jgi:hypothetical protein
MKTKTFLILIFFGYLTTSYSQISEISLPTSFNEKYSDLMRIEFKSLSHSKKGRYVIKHVTKQQVKGEIERKTTDCFNCQKYKYYGKEIDVNIDFLKIAKQIQIEEGSVYILNITSEAEGFQFLFDKFYLPKGCKLFFYNEEKSMYLGAFTDVNNREDGRFVSQFLNGNNVFIELFVPSYVNENILLSLNRVVFIADEIFNQVKAIIFDRDSLGSGGCNINTSCDQGAGWKTEIKSVALILQRQYANWETYWGWCSGALINKESNYSDSDKPFFLSANHCYEIAQGSYSDPSDWVFVFRYETPFCSWDGTEITRPEALTKSAVGATVISHKGMEDGSDFLLLQLNNTVQQIKEYDIAFAGWNATSTAISTNIAVGIHHPSGDVKKISTTTSSLVPSPWEEEKCLAEMVGANNFIRLWWEDGVTEGGSSGSPLFNHEHEIIGTLTGGSSSCQMPSSQCPEINGKGPDFYGMFSKSFFDGNLSQYLTPSTSALSISSYEPTLDNYLSLSINTLPTNVYTGSSFKVTANAQNGGNLIHWYFWINKYPDDFNDYSFDSENCYHEYKTTTDRLFETTSSYSFSIAGTYKGKIYAFDNLGRQSTSVFSIDIADRSDPCISTHLYQLECGNQLEFPIGSSINLYDYCFVDNSLVYQPDECHLIQFIGSDYVQPKYQGIVKLRWLLDNSQVGSDIVFNTTEQFQYLIDAPSTPIYYLPTYNSKCFTLNSEGVHTLRLEAYGGRMSTDGYQFTHPFIMTTGYSSISKKIKVVDCNKSLLITSITELNNINGSTSAGYLTIDPPLLGLLVRRGAVYDISAYQEVSLEPNIHFSLGSSVTIKTTKCPDVNCNCTLNKSTKFYKDQINYLNPVGSDYNLLVYPNPTSDFFHYEIPINFLGPIRFEMINNRGVCVMSDYLNSNCGEIDVHNFLPGIYYIILWVGNNKYIGEIIKQ